MKLQITLRESVPIEAELIKYLESIGPRSGEPKRLILNGFTLDGIKEPTQATKAPENEPEEPQEPPKKENKSKSFAVGG